MNDDLAQRVADLENEVKKFRQVIYGDDDLQLPSLVVDVRELTNQFKTWSERLKTFNYTLRFVILLFGLGFLTWIGQLRDALEILFQSWMGG